MNNDIQISVYILTYFHENYIRQSIESVLKQKTNYKYEIVISDDGSTDRTPLILKEYAEKYPDLIRINLNTNNLGIPKNIYIARCMCRGRYIVSLSGDDYWTNEYKLQKQAEYLDNHPECFGDVGRLEMIGENENNTNEVLPSDKESDILFTINDFESGKNLITHGIMIRNEFLTAEGRNYFGLAKTLSDKVDDAVDVVLFLRKGPVYVMRDVFEVYRTVSSNNVHNYNSIYSLKEKFEQEIFLYNNLYNQFKDEIHFRKRYVVSFTNYSISLIKNHNTEEVSKVYRTIPKKMRFPLYKSVAVLCFFAVLKKGIKKIICFY